MSDKHILRHVVAGVLVKKDNKYLLVQERQPSAYKLWNWPAGRVEESDYIETTAVKEAKEETGYDVKLIRKLDIFQESANEPPQHLFEAEITGGELEYPKDELLNARWFTLDELKSMKPDEFRGEWILEGIKLLGDKV